MNPLKPPAAGRPDGKAHLQFREWLLERYTGSLRGTLVVALATVIAIADVPTLAQESRWPSERPIRLIVPFQAGSFSDVTARTVSQRLAERLGQQIVIDNRIGGAGMVGTEAVARAEFDGYTMGFVNTMMSAQATALLSKPPYDAVKDFTPV